MTFDPLRERLHTLEATVRELVDMVRELTARMSALEHDKD